MQKDIDVQKDYGKFYIVVTPFFPTEDSFRGPYIYDQVKAIIRNSEYKVLVFVPSKKNDHREFYEYGGIKVHLFPIKNTPSYFFNGIFNSYNANSFLNVFTKLQIDGKQVVYIHCHTSTFGAIGTGFKNRYPQVKVLLQHHCRDPYTILNGKLASWYPNLYFRAKSNIQLFSRIDVHISISKIVEDNLKKFPNCASTESFTPYLQKIKKLHAITPPNIKKSIVLYNGVDKRKFYPYLNNSRNKALIRIGCIANFIKLKDQITLIKAIELLINNSCRFKLKLTFIGSGPELQSCKNYVKNKRLLDIIEFLPEVDHSQLCAFYNTLDLFILPSVYEGFGCVFTEAYACGVPFMICENQGATEYIPTSEYDKWVFRKHDNKQLANMILAFINHRYHQTLKYPYDIDVLIKAFLDKLEHIKNE